MAVASSTDSARVLHNLETAGVRGYFSAVIGGDQVTHSKPEPEIFLKAAAALDTPPGLCMVLELSLIHIWLKSSVAKPVVVITLLTVKDA